MFTNIHDDTCSVFDSNRRNEKIYDWNLNQDPNFRRKNGLHQLIYGNTHRGIEQDINVENNLIGLNYVLNTCNLYEAGIQEAKSTYGASQGISPISNDLRPQYTKVSKLANHINTYENPYRPQPGYYNFVTPPEGVQRPAIGLYSFDRLPVDTRQIAKDQIRAENKNLRKCGGYR